MNWLRLLDIIAMAMQRVGQPSRGKPDAGYNWACYCSVCCALRRLVA